jgi:hypothetical protein
MDTTAERALRDQAVARRLNAELASGKICLVAKVVIGAEQRPDPSVTRSFSSDGAQPPLVPPPQRLRLGRRYLGRVLAGEGACPYEE